MFGFVVALRADIRGFYHDSTDKSRGTLEPFVD
jgi:hypothetical protein